MKVIDTNDDIKKFDFSSLITYRDRQEAITVIKQIIADGNYFTNSPRFQTKENLFARQEPCWLKFRMSFMFSVFMYLGHEVKISNAMAWSFMTNLETAEDRDKLWHHHQIEGPRKISGIYYLYIPEDAKDRDYCGTEMAPNGLDSDNKFFVKPTIGTWLIYPSGMYHRPGITQSNDYRFVLAADIEIH